jgi:AcrR family transcriptional regulator
MTTTDEPRRYHHGDLANALLAKALEVVERDGPDAVSLRGLADQLGVSRAAPYRHFADRDALMAAVAALGFEELNVVYEAALRGPGAPIDRLRSTAKVYFDFARRRPGLFKLMFESDLLTRANPPKVLIGPADRSYHLLWEMVGQVFPEADEREIKARTLTMWSTVYGFLALQRSGRIKPFMVRPLSDAEVEEAVLRASLPISPSR